MGKSMQPIFLSKCKLVLSTSPVDVVFYMLLIMNISAGFLPASLWQVSCGKTKASSFSLLSRHPAPSITALSLRA